MQTSHRSLLRLACALTLIGIAVDSLSGQVCYDPNSSRECRYGYYVVVDEDDLDEFLACSEEDGPLAAFLKFGGFGHQEDFEDAVAAKREELGLEPDEPLPLPLPPFSATLWPTCVGSNLAMHEVADFGVEPGEPCGTTTDAFGFEPGEACGEPRPTGKPCVE